VHSVAKILATPIWCCCHRKCCNCSCCCCCCCCIRWVFVGCSRRSLG